MKTWAGSYVELRDFRTARLWALGWLRWQCRCFRNVWSNMKWGEPWVEIPFAVGFCCYRTVNCLSGRHDWESHTRGNMTQKRCVWCDKPGEWIGFSSSGKELGKWTLKTMIQTARWDGQKLEHAATCGVAKQWTNCDCGHFKGFDKPLHGPRHKDTCPCHCTCDFALRLEEIILANGQE